MSRSFAIIFLTPPLHQLEMLEEGTSFASFTGDGQSQGEKQKQGRVFFAAAGPSVTTLR